MDDELRSRVAWAAGVLEGRSGKPVRVGAVGAPGSWPRVVVGRPTDPAIAPLLLELGAHLDGEELYLGDAALGGDESVLHLCAPDPHRPGLPLRLLLAEDPHKFADSLEDLEPLARPGLALVRPRRPAQRFDPRGRLPVGDAAIEQWPFEELESDDVLAFFAEPQVERERLKQVAERNRAALRRIAEWTGVAPGARLELLALDSVEQMLNLTGRAELAVDTGTGARIALLVAPGIPEDGGAAAARWAASRSVRAPGSWWLDGLSLDAAGSWWGRPLVEWGGHLRRAGLIPGLERITDERSVAHLSQHILAPARGLLCRYLRLQEPARWRRLLGGEALVLDQELRGGFEAWLAEPAFVLDQERRADSWKERRGRLAARPWQNGVALDSNAKPGGGYGGRGLEQSLRGASELGADAVSITSEFSARLPGSVLGGPIVHQGRTSLEGDAALVHAIASARRSGARTVLLQPHLLLSDSAGYSAWLRRVSIAHWEDFFDGLESMLMHYALLGELFEVDLLCVGTELTSPNVNEGLIPATKAFHDEGWAEAIVLVRGAYGGSLTYAAGWPGEARAFPHWEQLDYVGLALFPRFASLQGAAPATPALRYQWGTILGGIAELSASVQRPALIVELGLRSTERAGTETAVGTGPADEAEQARLWASFSAALEDKHATGEAPAGLYLWKWPAAPGSDERRGFSPSGKAAAPVLRTLSPGN
jgi:hypothetical protein